MGEVAGGRFVRVRLSLDEVELAEAAARLRATFARQHLDLVADVSSADVFVGVYGDRYGAMDARLGVSRLEHDYLAAGQRPRLVYVLPEGDREEHLQLLLSRIRADDQASYRRVSGPEELAELAADDIAMVLTEAFTRVATPAATEAVRAPRPGVRARIPAPWHRLVGRAQAVDEVCRLLAGPNRLLSVTGPGGIGKSRLAIEVAACAVGGYRDGAWFVDLAGCRDPALVAPMIAHALGVREAAGALPVASLKTYLASMNALILLDSFEPVLAAAPLVVDLLASAPDVRVLVTSRSVLRVRGEQEYSLPPLRVPEPGEVDPVASPALELFLERAAAANPTRTLSASEYEAAAEICRRLDGVPLALELAAARTRVLSPSALLGKLTEALDVLGSGPVDLPERQRALRTTLDWDHALLGEEEAVIFRRLAVFPRWFTLAAAEVAVGEDVDVMDGLDGLVGKSLVRSTDPHPVTNEPSFVMLQTVREYAHERLQESGEHEDVHRRHAQHLLDRLEAADSPADLEDWLDVLEHEHADLRVALDWTDRALEVDMLLRLACRLGVFWRVHCHFSEGRRWLDRALALSAGQRTSLRAQLLDNAGYLARARGEYDGADQQYRESLAIRQALADTAGIASSLRLVGNIAYDRGDLAGADEYWHESLAVLEGSGDDEARMRTLNNLGVLGHHRGEQREALELFEQAYAIAARLGLSEQRARAHMNMALALAVLGEDEQARDMARDAVALYADLDDTWDLVDSLDVLAGAVGRLGDSSLAAWLFGGAATLRAALDVRRPVFEVDEYERAIAEARDRGPETFDRAYAEGADASLSQIVARAMEVRP